MGGGSGGGDGGLEDVEDEACDHSVESYGFPLFDVPVTEFGICCGGGHAVGLGQELPELYADVVVVLGLEAFGECFAEGVGCCGDDGAR